MQQQTPTLSPEVMAALALGIPSLVVAGLSLWVAYLTFNLAQWPMPRLWFEAHENHELRFPDPPMPMRARFLGFVVGVGVGVVVGGWSPQCPPSLIVVSGGSPPLWPRELGAGELGAGD